MASNMTGDIQARNAADLAFRTGGRISDRLVDVGDRVVVGRTIARIEATQQRAVAATAAAALAAADAQYEQARVSHGRLRTLLDRGAVTRSAVDQTLEELEVVGAGVEAARAELRLAEDTLANTALVAPMNGVITARHAETGEVVQPAQPIFTLAEDGERDAVFDVYEAALVMVPDDVAIDLRILSNGQLRFVGRLREVSPSIDPLTGTIRIKVAIDGRQEALPLGATVVGSAAIRSRQAVTVPSAALTLSAEGPSVWVVDPESGRIGLRPVEILSFETKRVALAGGVEEGELIVVRGPRSMRPGLQVAVIEVQDR